MYEYSVRLCSFSRFCPIGLIGLLPFHGMSSPLFIFVFLLGRRIWTICNRARVSGKRQDVVLERAGVWLMMTMMTMDDCAVGRVAGQSTKRRRKQSEDMNTRRKDNDDIDTEISTALDSHSDV